MDEGAPIKKVPDKIEDQFYPIRHCYDNLGSLTLFPESNDLKIVIYKL